MILSCPHFCRSCLGFKHARVSSYRCIWNESCPSKISNEKTKNGVETIREIQLANENSSLQNNAGSSITKSGSAALKSLELALSECTPHSTTVSCNKTVQNNSHKDKRGKFKKNDSEKKQKSNDNSKSLKLGNGIKTKIKEHNVSTRFNEVNIQMLPVTIFQHLFGKGSYDKPSEKQILMAQEELEKHKLLNVEKTCSDEVSFKLPPLEGGTLESHFEAIGEEQSLPYRNLLNNLMSPLPEIPKKWLYQSGWTKYTVERPPQSVPYPDEDALV